MATNRRNFLSRIAERKLFAHWADMADMADRQPLSELRNLQQRLRPLAADLARIDRIATARVNGMANAIPKPRGTDWAYRPRLWRAALDHPGRCFVTSPGALDGETTLFHDCPLAEIGLRQEPTKLAGALSPFDLHLEVLHFQGSFLSLSIDLPEKVLADLESHHLFEVTPDLTTDRPAEIYLRLNLRQDQDVKQILASHWGDGGRTAATFDLAYSDVQPRMIDKIWLDVIFPNPAMTLFALSDLTITRRPRADF